MRLQLRRGALCTRAAADWHRVWHHGHRRFHAGDAHHGPVQFPAAGQLVGRAGGPRPRARVRQRSQQHPAVVHRDLGINHPRQAAEGARAAHTAGLASCATSTHRRGDIHPLPPHLPCPCPCHPPAGRFQDHFLDVCTAGAVSLLRMPGSCCAMLSACGRRWPTCLLRHACAATPLQFVFYGVSMFGLRWFGANFFLHS